jgi:hypothetical protein
MVFASRISFRFIQNLLKAIKVVSSALCAFPLLWKLTEADSVTVLGKPLRAWTAFIVIRFSGLGPLLGFSKTLFRLFPSFFDPYICSVSSNFCYIRALSIEMILYPYHN